MRTEATAASIMAAISTLLAPYAAFADDGFFKHHGAPEPMTVIGLGLGAAAIGAVHLISRRRASRKGDERG
jgi:hypothetical protein